MSRSLKMPSSSRRKSELAAVLLMLSLGACTRMTTGYCMQSDFECPRDQYCALPAQQCTAGIKLHAILNGGQVVPPTASQATGDFVLTVNDAKTMGHYDFNMHFPPPMMNMPMVAEIRTGAIGMVNQSALPLARINITNPPTSGDLPLNPDFISTLIAGQCYLIVTSTTFPNGEIRGQIFSPDPANAMDAQDPNALVQLRGILSGQQEAPGTNSTAQGVVTAALHESTGQLNVTYKLSGLTNNINGFHVHNGTFNVNGDILYDLPTPQGQMMDTISVGLDRVKMEQNHVFSVILKSGLGYLNIHTSMFPAGEMRAQLMPVGTLPTQALPFNVPLANKVMSGALGEAQLFLSADRTKLAFRLSHTATAPMAATLTRGAMAVTCAPLAATGGTDGTQGYCDVDATNMATGTAAILTLGDLLNGAVTLNINSSKGSPELFGPITVPKTPP